MDQTAFDPIKGIPLSIVRRAADMLVLSFGPITPTARGSVGVYALHIQCPWRIDEADRTITGSGDLWEYAGQGERPNGWTYEDGLSLQDQRLTEIFGAYDHSRGGGRFPDVSRFTVTDAACNDLGEIRIRFSGGHTLSAFPAGSIEAWRFFVPKSDDKHLVFPETTSSP